MPTFNKPTVNIGDRQKGRMRSSSVIDCVIDQKEIVIAINKALNMNCSNLVNPYGEGKSAEKIVSLIENVDIQNLPLQKQFYS